MQASNKRLKEIIGENCVGNLTGGGINFQQRRSPYGNPLAFADEIPNPIQVCLQALALSHDPPSILRQPLQPKP